MTTQKYLNRSIAVNSGNLLKKGGVFLAICCVSCGPDKEMIIRDKVFEKVASFREKQADECTFNLLAEAEKIVDSLLLAEAKYELSDSLLMARPPKPPKPAPIPAIDSLAVQPIFQQASSTKGKK